jgi:hypothetical protein
VRAAQPVGKVGAIVLEWLHYFALLTGLDIDHLPIKQAINNHNWRSPAADGYRILAQRCPRLVEVRSGSATGIPRVDFAQCGKPGVAAPRKYAKMPIIPLVVTPDGTGIQDSTPIIDRPRKCILSLDHPDDNNNGQFHFSTDRGVR